MGRFRLPYRTLRMAKSVSVSRQTLHIRLSQRAFSVFWGSHWRVGFGIIWSVELRITAIRNEPHERNGFADVYPAVRSGLELGTFFVSVALLFRPLNRAVLLSRMPLFLEAAGCFLVL